MLYYFKNHSVVSESRWKENKNYGMKDGLYVGMYGTCSSFEDYARFYNAAYYVNAGLSRGSQFCGAYGFLYSTEESAFISIDKLNGYSEKFLRFLIWIYASITILQFFTLTF